MKVTVSSFIMLPPVSAQMFTEFPISVSFLSLMTGDGSGMG